tara:strand:- start:45 stop:626 length:582 start_codon:yes stop_codon:yes gene_type:complete
MVLNPNKRACINSNIIYFGVGKNPNIREKSIVMVGKTERSVAERYAKTYIAFNWYGFELSSFPSYSKIERLISTTRMKCNPKRGEQISFEFENKLIEIGMKSENLRLDLMLEDLAIKVANYHFSRPKGNKNESYDLFLTFEEASEKVELICEEVIATYEVWLDQLEIATSPVRLSRESLFELYEKMNLEEKTG